MAYESDVSTMYQFPESKEISFAFKSRYIFGNTLKFHKNKNFLD